MVVFLYTQPYSSTTANIVEALFSILTIFMLLVTFGLPLNQFPVVLDGMDSECSSDNSIATLNTWIWTIVYYTPLIVTLGLIVLSMVQLIRSARKVDQQFQKSVFSHENL